MSKKLIVAIDGPSGSGKSTTAKLLADKLGFLYIDTGAMYRAVTFLAIEKKITDDPLAVAEITKNADISLNFIKGRTLISINGKDVTEEIRSLEVSSKVSEISKIEDVRKALVYKQRQLGNGAAGVVMEGRDIGTVVFPNADFKFFLIASIDERARRRTKEFKEKGKPVPMSEVKKNLMLRDEIDSTRDISPLTRAADAIEIDTTDLTIDEQVDKIFSIINKNKN
ncbi:MAG TPA: (d)CMP kinase [Ignavibacteriaceae bacterium]|nr:(d)CMP kinase [Ignavibacteriaceae bacterium]